MNKSIEIAAMILGSISLLTVCFLGFAVMSGVPLHQVAIIGSLFPEPVERAAEVDPNGAPTVDPSDEPSDEEIIAQGVGIVASSFVLPSPYDAVELKGLTDELKMRRQQLNAREKTGSTNGRAPPPHASRRSMTCARNSTSSSRSC